MRVFLSYAHTPADQPLAIYVESRLRAAAIDVWLDRSSLNAGQPTRQAIQEAVAGCDHGVFIVSQSWLTRDWTDWELGLFEARDPSVVRRIPILRRPRKELALPPLLFRFTGFEWLEDDREPDARIWELFCALQGTAPGPPSAWNARGHELPTPAAAPPLFEPRRGPAAFRPSLRCNRATQWKTVDDLSGSGRNELLLLPGEPGQDHEHFVQRVQHLLRSDPPRSIVRVDWPVRPASRDEYAEALAKALGTSIARLGAALGERLANVNLVLLHPCLRSRFLDNLLVRYYVEWLPAWIADARPRMNVKCVQPVEWPRHVSWLSLSRWVPGLASNDEDARPAAEELVRQCLDTCAPLLRAVRLSELQDLSAADLEDFCQIEALSSSQKEWLIARIGARQARRPRDVFQAIDDYLPDARSRT
jgi:hypothetical protein